MSRNYVYEHSNLVKNEEYHYRVPCKNHKVCNGLLPDKWLEVRGRYLCFPCEKTFGKLNDNPGRGILKFSDNILCLQCNNKADGVTYPRCEPHCEHYLCLQCFDNNWYSYHKIHEPDFPYNKEIRDEYYDEIDDKKWDNYALIAPYHKQIKLWIQLRNELFEKYKPFRICPICKK